MVANQRPIFSVGDAVMYRGELARVEQVQLTGCVIRELKSGWIVTVAGSDLTPAPGWLQSSEDAGRDRRDADGRGIADRNEKSRTKRVSRARKPSTPAVDSSSKKNRDPRGEPPRRSRSHPEPPRNPPI